MLKVSPSFNFIGQSRIHAPLIQMNFHLQCSPKKMHFTQNRFTRRHSVVRSFFFVGTVLFLHRLSCGLASILDCLPQISKIFHFLTKVIFALFDKPQLFIFFASLHDKHNSGSFFIACQTRVTTRLNPRWLSVIHRNGYLLEINKKLYNLNYK